METLYKAELHPYQTSEPKVIINIKPPAMISDTKPAAAKHLTEPGVSKYKCILEECAFNIVEVFTYCTKDENKISYFLPIFVGTGKKVRYSRASTSFLHNFVGVCV